jgi:hypothetical protein
VTFVLGLLLALLGIALFASLYKLWPTVERAPNADVTEKLDATLLLGIYEAKVSKSTGLILVALFAGALGAWIHAATSFSVHVARRNFTLSWLWWYALRPFAGAALALLFYFAWRAGLVTGNASTNVDPYGVAAIAGLAGLFSKPVTDKLKELLDVLFRTDSGRAPAIDSLEPEVVKQGDTPELSVLGERFETGAKVLVAGLEHATVVESAERLKTQLLATDTAAVAELSVTVRNPSGVVSPAKPLKVEA